MSDSDSLASQNTTTSDLPLKQVKDDHQIFSKADSDTKANDDKVIDEPQADNQQTIDLDNVTASNLPETVSESSDKQATSESDEEKLPSHIKLTGRLLNFTRLTLKGNQVDELLDKVKTKLGQQRQSNLPVVVSCEDALDLEKLWQGLWELGLQPIGIVTGVMDETANKLRIAIFPTDGQRLDAKVRTTNNHSVSTANHKKILTDNETSVQAAEVDEKANVFALNAKETSAKSVTSEPLADAQTHTQGEDSDKLNIEAGSQSQMEGDLIHNLMLRSGQSINHVGGDLILTKGINAGAEAITDYSLHVYGKAEGRLVAGATGDKNARIFCLKFNPSLVSVAGTYCVKENIPKEFINQSVQVSYDESKGLVFSLMA